MSLEPKIEYRLFRPPDKNEKTVQNDSELIDYMEYRFQAIHDNSTEILSETDTPSAFEPQYEIMRDKLLKLPESTFHESKEHIILIDPLLRQLEKLTDPTQAKEIWQQINDIGKKYFNTDGIVYTNTATKTNKQLKKEREEMYYTYFEDLLHTVNTLKKIPNPDRKTQTKAQRALARLDRSRVGTFKHRMARFDLTDHLRDHLATVED